MTDLWTTVVVLLLSLVHLNFVGSLLANKGLVAWVRISAAVLVSTLFAVRRNQSKLPSLKPSPLRLTRGRRIETRKLTWIKACFSDLIFLWAKVYQKLWSVKPCLICTKSSMKIKNKDPRLKTFCLQSRGFGLSLPLVMAEPIGVPIPETAQALHTTMSFYAAPMSETHARSTRSSKSWLSFKLYPGQIELNFMGRMGTDIFNMAKKHYGFF